MLLREHFLRNLDLRNPGHLDWLFGVLRQADGLFEEVQRPEDCDLPRVGLEEVFVSCKTCKKIWFYLEADGPYQGASGLLGE
jgi:hypothetical protein